LPEVVKKPLRVLFVDEMRYGLISNTRRSWSKRGKRSVYKQQHEYISRYLYSAIDPINGESFHLMGFDDICSKHTELFLKALKEKFSKEHLVIVWDRAPFHRQKLLQKEHMSLIFLPSYSPQLNPVERFFEEIRKFTANKIFPEGITALSKTIEDAIKELCESFEALKQLTGYQWILEQWKTISSQRASKCAC